MAKLRAQKKGELQCMLKGVVQYSYTINNMHEKKNAGEIIAKNQGGKSKATLLVECVIALGQEGCSRMFALNL